MDSEHKRSGRNGSLPPWEAYHRACMMQKSFEGVSSETFFSQPESH